MINEIPKIFPDYFISGSIKNQKELNDVFLQYPNFSKTYIRAALYRENNRKWYEDNWTKVYKYLDKNFFEKFQTEAGHNSRAWEFHLAVVLIDKGFNIIEKTWKTGPDFFIIPSSGKKVWIEAVACDLGKTGPNQPCPFLGGQIEDEHRPRALRITNAISEKFKKFKEYIKNPKCKVTKDDCLIIAVNGAAIQYPADSTMLFKRSIFGQGPDILVRIRGQKELKGGFYKPMPTIKKKSDNIEKEIPPIPANFMEMDDFSIISAVLYCGNTVTASWLNGYDIGDDFLFAHHTNPNNPIPKNLFKFGREIRKDKKTGSISDRGQKIMIY